MTQQTTTAGINQGIDASLALDSLRHDYPWLGSWHIDISGGLVGIVAEFCQAIEPILGPQPRLDFLHVFDEINPDSD